MITLNLEKIKIRKFGESAQVRSIYFTLNLVLKFEPFDVNAVEPSNYQFRKYNFQNITMRFYSFTFFLLLHVQLDLHYHPLHSSLPALTHSVVLFSSMISSYFRFRPSECRVLSLRHDIYILTFLLFKN